MPPENEDGFFFDPMFRNSKGKIVEAPELNGVIADTHCHLDMLEHPELSLARCAYYNVMLVLTVVEATEEPQRTYDMLAEWLAEASAYLDKWDVKSLLPACRIVAGTHPHNASDFDDNVSNVVRTCAMHPLTVAIGEIGLDYHYDRSPRDVQREVFRRQINLAHELNKPIVLHVREAHDDALDILDAEGIPEAGALLHCFTSDWDTLQAFLDRDCYVAFGGALTFSNGEEIRDAAIKAPLNRILTETDSPFMSPAPLRGTVCSPENVVFTTKMLMDLRGIESKEADTFLDNIFKNAIEFFAIDTHIASK